MKPGAVQALLFDKDGTLFHFGETWNAWALSAIARFAGEDEDLRAALAQAARYDLESRSFAPDSPVIAGTNREAAECFLSVLPGYDLPQVEAILTELAKEAPLVPTVDLPASLTALKHAGLALGLMTNDSESAARSHLGQAGILDLFDFVAGFDSGHGAKPDAAPLLAFADAVRLPPQRCAMIGDSSHDLTAGRAAGMKTVGVLTGPARAPDLAPLADVILPDIGHLPVWLGRGFVKNDG